MKKIICLAVLVILVGSVATPIILESVGDPEKDDLDVFILAGQSNAAYTFGISVEDAQLNPVVPNDVAFYYGDDKPIVHHSGSVNYDPTLESYSIHDMVLNGSWKIGGIDAAIASNYYDDTGRKLLVINAAINGISILGYANENGTGWSYTDAVIRDALSKVDKSKFEINCCGLFWLQGESDRTRDVDIYVDNFTSFWNSISKNYGFKGAYLIDVRDGQNTDIAHQILAERIKTIHYVDSVSSSWLDDSEYMTSDDIHYNQKGKNIIGAEFVNSYILTNPSINDIVDLSLLYVIPLLLVVAIISVAATIFLKNRY